MITPYGFELRDRAVAIGVEAAAARSASGAQLRSLVFLEQR
jgi:hypothetical protein